MVVEVSELAPSNKKSAIRVLHVDDDLCFLEVSKQILSMENNFEIDNAASVGEAFKKMEQQPYDAVVSDYEMPQKNGLEFLKEIKEKNSQIPFILFTGKGREDVAVKALNLGADSYINKNGSPETVYCELADAINKTIERKKSKKALAESELKYRIMVEKSLQGILITQTSPIRLVFANASMSEILGYSTEELKSLSPEGVAGLIYSEDRTVFFKRLESRMLGEPAPSSLEFRAVRKNGSIVWLAAFANRIDYMGQPAVQGMFLDISESKKAEQILKENEARYRELADSLPDIVFEIDLNGKLTFFNQRAFEITGYTREDFEKGLNIFQLATSEDIQRGLENMQKSLTGKSHTPTECTITRKNGTAFTGLIRASPRISENKVMGLRAIVIDITERKKNDLEIKQKNEALESVAESIDSGLAVISKDYSVVWANKYLMDLGVAPNKKCYQTFNSSETVCPDCGAKKVFEQNASLAVHEFKTVNSKGETVWIELRVTPLKDKAGNVTAALELAVPITERKKAEEKNAWLASFPMLNPNPVLEISFEGNISYLNSAAESIFPDLKKAGLSYPILSGWNDVLATFRNEKNRTFGRNIKINDAWFYMQFNLLQETQQVRIYITNVTEIKQAEEALQESETKFRMYVENSPVAVFVADSEGKYEYVNEAASKLLGYTAKELMGMGIPQIVFKEELPASLNNFATVQENGKILVELRLKNKDGQAVNVSLNAVKLPNGKLIAFCQNITERKKNETTLRQSEEQFRQLFSTMPSGVAVYEAVDNGEDFVFKDFNAAAEKIEKINKDDVLGKRVTKVFAGVKSFGIFEVFQRVWRTGQSEYFPVALYKDNKELGSWRENWIYKLPNGNIVAIYNDITERKKAEEALNESSERSRAIVANSPIGIATSGADKHFLSANDAFCRILGYTEDELRKLTFKDITHSEDFKESVIKMGELENGRISFTLEKRYVKKDGTVIDGKIMVSAVRNQNGKLSLFVAELEDITERKKAEELRKVLERKVNDYSKHLKCMVELRTAQLKDANERLVKSERLAAIGELAGMVGHDLRNPLSGIKNAAYFLKKKGATISEEQTKEMLEIIDKGIDHSNKIINDLLDYSREMHLDLRECSPRALLDDAVRMIPVPDRIQIVNHVLGETRMRVDADKIMRVFINLIKNAVDAMPEKGTLEITSRQTKSNLEIAFADTGKGIPDETLPKIFTPLFTTKAQGMGFGLAICKRIIEAHGGTITVETAVNKGTTFTITLPLKPKVKVEGEKTWVTMPESMSMMMKTKT